MGRRGTKHRASRVGRHVTALPMPAKAGGFAYVETSGMIVHSSGCFTPSFIAADLLPCITTMHVLQPVRRHHGVRQRLLNTPICHCRFVATRLQASWCTATATLG